jgi:hypothetical protein
VQESPSHTDLARTLAAEDTGLSAAEVHGALTAVLCAATAERAMPALLRFIPQGASGALGEMLLALLRRTGEQLHDPQFGFALLLPGEEAPLDQQVAALADWCRGFLIGVADPARLAGDAGEVVRDLARIAAVEPDTPQAGSEEQERDLAELVEYVRVGVQLVFEQLQARPRRDH